MVPSALQPDNARQPPPFAAAAPRAMSQRPEGGGGGGGGRWFGRWRRSHTNDGVTAGGADRPVAEAGWRSSFKPSSSTRQRVEATKSAIENHYMRHMQSLKARSERRRR